MKNRISIVKVNSTITNAVFQAIHGCWFVTVRSHDNKRWFGYLHSDGSVSYSTKNNDSRFTGWYKTRKAAREAVKLFKSKA